MPSKYDAAFEYLMGNEGGFSNHPMDHGGATAFGVTEEEATRYGYDVRHMTRENAKEFYKRARYWCCDGIRDERVMAKFFDMRVQFGKETATMMLQRVLGVGVDGVYGPKTETAVNSFAPDRVLDRLVIASAERYLKIVKANRSQLAFIIGWLTRALRTP